ncbi:MAG: hypothetical protein ACO1N9_01855 [Flavobacterium sp.]
MKKLVLPFAIASLLLASCSGDDGGNPANNNIDAPTADFIPLDEGNYWVYNVDGQTASGQDHLYISGTETINEKEYDKFLTLDAPLGFYSNSLYNNGMRQDGDKLVVTGQTQFEFAEGVPLNIGVTDFVIFKEHATSGQLLGTTSGTITQMIEGYNMQINYVLTTTAKGDLASHTVGGETYSNVKKVETVLNLTITSPMVISGIPFNATIMPAQNVVVSTQYYAKEIGVVHVETDINYTLADFSQFGVTLPVPQSFTDHQEEVLDEYSVN